MKLEVFCTVNRDTEGFRVKFELNPLGLGPWGSVFIGVLL